MPSALGVLLVAACVAATGPPWAEAFAPNLPAPHSLTGGHSSALHARVSALSLTCTSLRGRIATGIQALQMGRVGGNSGYSRSVPGAGDEPSKAPFSKAMARPNPLHSPEIVGPGYAMREEDKVDEAGRPRKWLSVFDFDGTLFRAPVRFVKNGSVDPPNAGIRPPIVPSKPGKEWFDEEVCRAARDRANSKDHTAVLLSERPHSQKERITELCEGQGIKFDKVVLRPDGKHADSAASFKSKWVRKFLKHLRIAEGKGTRAEVWDDSAECRYDMGRIDGVVVHAVLGRYGPPMEVGGNVQGYAFPDSIAFGAGKEDCGGVEAPFMFGYAMAQGKRDYMEDRVVAKQIATADGGVGHVLAVFDGHGGSEAANWASSNVWKRVEDLLVLGEEPEEALRTAFMSVDEEWCDWARANGDDDSGSTGLVCLVLGSTVYCASAGDGAAVVLRNGADPEMLSTPHKPDSPGEEKRIRKLGGKVIFRDCARLNGILAVSRGFGDLSLKQWVTAEPAVRQWEVTGDDAALVISSDGMTDVLLNSEVQHVVDAAPNPEAAARELVDVALAKGTTDNLGILVLDLASLIGPKEPSAEEVKEAPSAGGEEGPAADGDAALVVAAAGKRWRANAKAESTSKAFKRSGSSDNIGKDGGMLV